MAHWMRLALWLYLSLCSLPRASFSFGLQRSSFTGMPVTISSTPLRLSVDGHLFMRIRIGLLGLPNVGKSSLLNSLAQKVVAEAADYPFCTIDPNTAILPVPDDYLERLAAQSNHTTARPAVFEWVDVAGLCKNAHKGEGLGNRFLGNLRECSALVHVLGVFSSSDIVEDAEICGLELLLADLEHTERRLARKTCLGLERSTLERVRASLLAGVPARHVNLSDEEKFSIKSMGLLTLKPVLYCFNVDEADFTMANGDTVTRAKEYMAAIAHHDGASETPLFVVVSAQLESELLALSKEETVSLLQSLGIEQEGTINEMLAHHVLPVAICQLLGYEIAYTGPGVPKERSGTTKAHLFRPSTLNAVGLASRLHGDIFKGFVRAEVISAGSLLEHKSFVDARETGQMRSEGKAYVLQPNDVVFVRWQS